MKRKTSKSNGGIPEDDHQKIESQRFDKFFRQNMRFHMPGITEKVLGLHIVEFTELKDKQQLTHQLEVDVLRKVTDTDGNTYILHVEIQTENDPLMVWRILQYKAFLALNYQLPVKQYVLYAGSGKLTMPNYIREAGLQFEYTQISFSTVPYELFLSSDVPEEQLLAILGDIGGEDPLRVMERVVSNIDHLPVSNTQKNKYIEQLRIIVQLRKFGNQMKEAMLKVASFFKVENDPFYIEGEEKKSYEVVSNLLSADKFTIAEIANFASVTEDFVRKVKADLAKRKK